ncbi:MAG: mechanosensitive ion channel family protein [Gemmatimonadota bacterium]
MLAIGETSSWLLPAAFLLGGLVLGLVVERLLLGRLRRAARATAWRWDDFLVGTLGHAPVALLTAAGAYAALVSAPLAADVREVLERVLAVLVIAAVTLVAARMSAGLVSLLAERSQNGLPASSLITNLTKFLVILLGVVIILQNLDVSITPLVTGLGLSGLAVALALQPTLANVFSGFQIIAARQVSPGDYIRLDTGDEGYVLDIKWRNTTIKSLYEDHQIVVPNSKLADAILTNYSLPRPVLWMRIEVGVSYESDLEAVEAITLEVARDVAQELAGRIGELEPTVRYQGFGDSSIDFQVRIPVENFARQFEVRHEFVKRLHRRYRDAGIDIPFPIRTLDIPAALGGRAPAAEGGEA